MLYHEEPPEKPVLENPSPPLLAKFFRPPPIFIKFEKVDPPPHTHTHPHTHTLNSSIFFIFNIVIAWITYESNNQKVFSKIA